MKTISLAERICAAYKRWFQPQEPREMSLGTIRVMEELGLVLRPICRRMLSEGWILKDGKLIKVHGDN